mgnify:CR=1 FL=1
MNKTIEEKAKAYDEAIEKARKIQKYSSDLAEKKRMEELFPELKESEDERIRKDIMEFIKRNKSPLAPVPSDDCLDMWIAWLEKQGSHQKFRDSIQIGDEVTRNQDGVLVNLSQLQRVAKKGEQNATKRSEKDEKVLEYLSMMYNESEFDADYIVYQNRNTGFEITAGEFNSFVKSLRPQKQWDVKDDRMLCDVIAYAQAGIKFENTPQLEWLETLRDRVLPQNHWKPSEYELEALRKVANTATLGALYEQLKKL